MTYFSEDIQMDDLGQNDDNIDDDIDDNIDDDIDNEIDIDDDDEIDYEIYQTDYAAAGDSAKTSFTNPDAVKKASDAEGLNLRQKILASAVDSYYDALGIEPSLGRDINRFVLRRIRGTRIFRLRLKSNTKINIVNVKTGTPNSLDYVAKQGGVNAVREGLGFSNWNPGDKKQKLSPSSNAKLEKTDQQVGEAVSAIETAPLEDLGQVIIKVEAAVQIAGNVFVEPERPGVPSMTQREFLGIYRALETIRGELTNNLAKLSELDKDIASEKSKLEEAPDEATKDRIAESLRKLQDERAARLEAASSTREALRSQISRIRETLHRILHEDKTLAERIKTLFREQGVTIVSILTALGMIISTIVLAIPGGGAAAPTQPPQPPGKGGAKEWIKKQLQSLGRILAKLVGKAAAALPRIIGSIVSWLLSLLGKTAVWLSSNLWAFLLAVGGLLLVAAR